MGIEFPANDVLVMEDPYATLTAEEVIGGSKDAKFHPLAPGKASLGITSSVWWLRFEARNPTAAPIDWVFNFPFPMIDLVDIYVLQDGRETGRFELGDKRPFSARVLAGEGDAVPVTTEPGKATTIYVRMHNILGDGLDAYFEVSPPGAYGEKQLRIWIFLGAILGGGLVLLLYNAVVYLVVRDSLYIWYLLYLFFALSTFVAASGLGRQLSLWSHEGVTSEAIPPVASSLAFFFVLQFSRRFLDTRRSFPRIDGFLKTLMVYFLVPPVAFFAGHSGLAATMIMSGSLALTMLPFLGAYVWLKGQKTALIFIMAWGFWFGTVCAMSSRILGLAPTNDFTLRIGWIGILGEAVLFALALAHRIRSLRLEKAAAEEREHVALRRSHEELEAQVRQRTQELADRNNELRRLNSEKDKLFSIVAHDLRNPFTGVAGISELLGAGIHKMSAQEIDGHLRDLRQSASIFNKLLENLLSWALLQLGGMKFRPEPLDLKELIDRCIGLFAQQAQEKGLGFEMRGIDVARFEADPQMLETVIRNLLSNAIKYSRPGGRIAVSANRNGNAVEISVADQGVGMDEQRLAKLFDFSERTTSPGTRGERGTGLGLQLCKELVEIHGGKLAIESRIDEGTTFRFSLPQ